MAVAAKEPPESPATAAARAMAAARWAKRTPAERKKFMAYVRAFNSGGGGRKPNDGGLHVAGPGRKRLPERCFCGQRSLHSAAIRRFDCCRRAGVALPDPLPPVPATRRSGAKKGKPGAAECPV